MPDYGEKLKVPHPSPNHTARVWFNDTDTLVWEVTDLETGEQSREEFLAKEPDLEPWERV